MWRKDNSPLFQDTIALTVDRRFRDRLSIENDNTLIISNATGADSGSYRCEVLGENMTVTHQVIVKTAPYNISVQAEGNGAEVSILFLKLAKIYVNNCFSLNLVTH